MAKKKVIESDKYYIVLNDYIDKYTKEVHRASTTVALTAERGWELSDLGYVKAMIEECEECEVDNDTKLLEITK